MSLLERTKHLLREYRIVPKKRLGQNFTVNPSIFKCMIDYASLEPSDVVLDIGAGLGFLTSFLAEKCSKVLAVEKDSKLVNVLREQLAALSNIEIVEGDVLKVKISRFSKIVSTPPYQISSALIEWLFDKDFDSAVLVLQKEFADRLAAPVGSKEYGWLTVIAHYYLSVELLNAVPKRMFYPEPEVDSVIVRLKPKHPHPFVAKDETLFKRLTKILFTQRNRKLRNAIVPFIRSTREVGIERKVFPFHDKRVRELAPKDFGALANVFAD